MSFGRLYSERSVDLATVLAMGTQENKGLLRATAEARTVGGESYPQAYCYVFRVEDGRLTEVIEYCDPALVERILTLPEQSGE